MTGVLHGLVVIDCSWGVAGPVATMILADNGARVTRIEPPRGDPFARGAGVWHRGKRRAVIDLGDPEGAEAFRRLALAADVVVETFSPGTMERLGLSYEALAPDNPGLVWCSIPGYPRGTSLSARPGYDGLVAARTGLLWDQRGRPGSPMFEIAGRPPPLPGVGVPEGLVRGAGRDGPLATRSARPSFAAGMLAVLGIAAALRAREITGRGQRVETSLLQGALCAAALVWQRVGNPDAPLYWMWPADGRSVDGLFECADGRWVHHWPIRPGWVLTAAEGDGLTPSRLEGPSREDPDRLGMEPEDMLVGHFAQPLLAGAFRRFPAAAWVEAAAACGTGVAPVRSPAEALADPSFLEDGCVVELDHPRYGRVRHVGNVLAMGAAPGIVRPVVEPGAHTAEVLAEAAAARPRPAPPARGELRAPLEGVRVVDLGLGVAGPFAGRLLADLGADVVKVHAPHDVHWAGTHVGLGTNRGKRSVAVNLADPRGREVLERLLAGADVVVNNWRPGAARRLGVDAASLRARFPRLVVCTIRGYERGPRAELPGTDQTASALCGVEWEDGACDTGNPPVWSRTSFGDIATAVLAAAGVALALHHRERTGEGQAVETSLVNACLLTTSYAWIRADGTPGGWERLDAGQRGLGPFYRLYRTRDGWLFIAAVQDHERRRLFDALGRADLADAPPGVVAEAVEAALAGMDARAAFALLDGAGVPVEVVDASFCRTMFDDFELRTAGLVARTAAHNVGTFEDAGLLVRPSGTPGVVQRGPCLCGEHTREILRELGYDDAAVDALVAAGVVAERA